MCICVCSGRSARARYDGSPDSIHNLSHFQDCWFPLNRGRIEATSEDDGLKAIGVQIDDEARIPDHLGARVRETVEQTLNALLDTEADRL
jgi:hypothetical protein